MGSRRGLFHLPPPIHQAVWGMLLVGGEVRQEEETQVRLLEPLSLGPMAGALGAQ